MGAGQLEQEHPVTVLDIQGLLAPHPGHLGAHSCGAADIQAGVNIFEEDQARVCGLRAQSDLTPALPGWSIVHAACFLGLCLWRTDVTDVTSLPEDLLLIKVRWPSYSAVPGTLLKDTDSRAPP